MARRWPGAGGGFLRQFLQHCATGTNAVTGNTGTRLDLVSFHAKGGVAITDGHVQMDLGTQLRLHRAGFDAVAAFSQFKQTPIYITEADPDGCAACPASTMPADAYRNSTAYGAYEIAMMKHTIDLEAREGVKLGGVLTWAFTFPGTPYFAGYRALATNGINLPVMGAFKLLGRLAGTRLPLTSSGAGTLDDVLADGVRGAPQIDGMATLDGDAVQVLVWNYHDDIVTVAATPVHLTINVPASFGSSVRVSHLRVDESHGDAYTVWVSQGMPASPSAAQIAALQAAMDPSPLVPDRTVAVAADGAVAVDFDLPRFGVSLVTITLRRQDEHDDALRGQGDPERFPGHAAAGSGQRLDVHPLGLTEVVVGVLRRAGDDLCARDRIRGPAAGQRDLNRPGVDQVHVRQADVDASLIVHGRARRDHRNVVPLPDVLGDERVGGPLRVRRVMGNEHLPQVEHRGLHQHAVALPGQEHRVDDVDGLGHAGHLDPIGVLHEQVEVLRRGDRVHDGDLLHPGVLAVVESIQPVAPLTLVDLDPIARVVPVQDAFICSMRGPIWPRLARWTML